MAYNPTVYVNDNPPAINADNLNKNENATKYAFEGVNNGLNVISAQKDIESFVAGQGLNALTGTAIVASNRIRTGLLNPVYAKTKSNYSMMVYAYDSNDNYIGILQTDYTFAAANNKILLAKEYIFSQDYGYRLVLRRDDNGDITSSEISNLEVYNASDKTLTEDGKPADAKVCGDKFNAIWDEYGLNLIKNDIVAIQGALQYGSGLILTTSTNRIATNNYISGIKRIIANSGYKFAVWAYDSSKTYMGCWSGTWSKERAPFWFNDLYIDKTYPYIRIGMKKDDDSDILPSVASNFKYYTYTDKTLTEDGKPADAKETGKISNCIENLADSISHNNYVSYKLEEGLDDFVAGAINSSGNDVDSGYTGNSFRTNGYREIGNAEAIILEVSLISSAYFYQYVFFYSENKTYLGRIGGQGVYKVQVEEYPTGAKFFRVSLTNVGGSNVASNKIEWAFNFDVSGVGSPKNKWYVFGDSISAGYFSITDEEAQEKGYTIAYRPEGLSGVGAVWMPDLSHNYWGYANEWFLKRNLQPNAYPGQGYLRTSADNNNGISKVKNTDVSDAGLITVAWGFNDWHYNQPRGNHDLIDPSVPYPTSGYDTSQITTVNQAIWYCLGELLRKAPNAKIVVQTPMNGWLYGGDWDSWWGLGTEKSHSGTLANIHDDIVYWANYYGLQILDMTYNNSVVNRRNIKDVLIDGSHPTDPAHMQLGRHVGIALKYM